MAPSAKKTSAQTTLQIRAAVHASWLMHAFHAKTCAVRALLQNTKPAVLPLPDLETSYLKNFQITLFLNYSLTLEFRKRKISIRDI